jgi:hypothetical protein
MGFIGSCLLAVFLLLLCVGVAKFIVVPSAKWALTTAFTSLAHEDGALRGVRQIISYPVVGLLSLQRRARRGDTDSAIGLFVIDICVGFLLSIFVQGFATTFLTMLAIAFLAFIAVLFFDE